MAVFDQLGQHDMHDDVELAHEPTWRTEPKATHRLPFEFSHEPQRLAQAEFA